jgi:hypothetical protein
MVSDNSRPATAMAANDKSAPVIQNAAPATGVMFWTRSS